MVAPAMVNMSAFNLSLTRVQLLKSQRPAARLPSDSQYVDVVNDKVS